MSSIPLTICVDQKELLCRRLISEDNPNVLQTAVDVRYLFNSISEDWFMINVCPSPPSPTRRICDLWVRVMRTWSWSCVSFSSPSDERNLWGRVMRTKLWLVYTLPLPSDERNLWWRVMRTRSRLVYALPLPLWREGSLRTSDVLQTRVLMWILFRLYKIRTDVVLLLQSMQSFFISGKKMIYHCS